MFVGPPRATPARGLAAFCWLALIAGCGSADPLGRAGVAVAPPPGWKAVAPTTWPVPGTPLAAWSGPGGASLVVYESLPAPEGRPDALALALVNRLENNPGLQVVSRSSETLGGLVAARVEVVAPGTGDALASTGKGAPSAGPGGKALRPTRRVVVTAVRPTDTLSLVWHAPEADAGALAAQVRATLDASKVDRGRLATSSY